MKLRVAAAQFEYALVAALILASVLASIAAACRSLADL